MQEDLPLVSVLMTAYNREKYIAEAIESVLASNYTHFELIIVDDCSGDATVPIARSFEQKDKRIKVYVNEQNLGDYNNRNHAASFATGRYIKYLDSDDTIYPWGLGAMVMCMEKYPEAGFGLMSYGLPQTSAYPILEQPQQAFRYFYFKYALIGMGPTGAIFRKDAFDAVNGFSGKPYVGDSEMWLRMACSYPLVRMPLDLVWWRQHDGQQIIEGRNNDYYFENQYGVYKAGLELPDCPLSADEKKAALNNLQNVRVRRIVMNYFLKMKFRKGFQILEKDGFKFFDVFKALRKNAYNIE